MSKKFDGAGILVICMRDSKPYVILVRNKKSKTYSDFGGILDKHDKICMTTAMRELREESRNLINITSTKTLSQLPYVDVLSKKCCAKFYRCYVLAIQNNIKPSLFVKNMKIIDKKSHLRCWKETDEIILLKLTALQECIYSHCPDIHPRTFKILYELFSNKLNLPCIKLKRIIDEKFYNTISYTDKV